MLLATVCSTLAGRAVALTVAYQLYQLTKNPLTLGLLGLGKSLLGVHGGVRALLPLTFALQLAAYTLPWLLPVPGARWLRLASVLERPLINLLSGRRRLGDLAEGLLGPVTPLLMLPVYARALRRRAVWKGREYRQ